MDPLTPKSRTLTAADVARQIDRFLEGSGGRQDWEDFLRSRIADPRLDAIRKRCVHLPEEFPPSLVSGRYCAPGGYAVLRGFVRELRNPDTSSVSPLPTNAPAPKGADPTRVTKSAKDGSMSVHNVVETEQRTHVAEARDLVVEDSPEPGILRRFRSRDALAKDAFTGTVYQGASARPAGYPADLPFVPSVEARVTQYANGTRVQQWQVEQVDVVREAVLRASAEEGWDRAQRPAVPPPVQELMHVVLLRRGDRWRYVTSTALAAGTFVKLVDVPAGTSWSAALQLR